MGHQALASTIIFWDANAVSFLIDKQSIAWSMKRRTFFVC